MAELAIHKTGILATGDELVVSGFAAGVSLSRFAPSVEVAPVSASLVLRLQGASGAAVSPNLEATIAAGSKVATPVSGAVPIAAGGSIYVRVQSAPTGGNAPSHLGGYFEFLPSWSASGTSFVTTAQLKSFAGISVATYDADLDAICLFVTSAMQQYIQRDLLSTAYSVEMHSLSVMTDLLVLRHHPILSVSSVLVDGVEVTGYVIDAESGMLFLAAGWWPGRQHISVSYTAGYAAVPPAIVGAALDQARFQWTRHARGGNRLGEAQRAEASGGSTAFIVDAWYPGVREIMDSLRRAA